MSVEDKQLITTAVVSALVAILVGAAGIIAFAETLPPVSRF